MKTLQQLNRRFSRLRALQRRLVSPPITHFTASGIRFNLPLRTTPRACQQLPQHTLEYLAGFFDGDGCVFADVRCATPVLVVDQCSSGSPVLLLFRSAFGGGIYNARVAAGLRRPVLTWRVRGKPARHAASLLASVASCKRSQLIIAADLPQTFESRAHAVAELKRLKNVPPSSISCPSWAYVAGFFDAEGCISMRKAQIVLIIGQKFPGILQALSGFLAVEGIACQLRTTKPLARLSVTATKLSKHALLKLLHAGLRVKRQAARTVLSMSPGDFLSAREDLARSVGYQNRYKRLSGEGLERSTGIRILSQKLKVAPDALRPSLQEELRQLRADHAWNCALERCAVIRSDVRSMLAHWNSHKR